MSSSINFFITLEDIFNALSELWMNVGGYVIQILIPLIILIVFWILLAGKYEDRKRLLISLSLIMFGVVLTFISPYSEELNTLFVVALYSPLIVYIYEFLKSNKKASDEFDKLSHNYRRTQVEKQSNLIGELLGELSTHASALKSYGIQELETKKWDASFKVGLISDIHTLSIARYYHLVHVFNRIIKDVNGLKKKYPLKNFEDRLKSLSEVKKTFFITETAVFHCLLYDLGLLQQNYLARPTVEFPLHMDLLLRKRLENFGILKNNDNPKKVNIFNKENLEKFNLKMGAHLNYYFAKLGKEIKNIDKKLREFS